jgi:tartrate-resistant acid phosphatase type 5
MAASYKNSMALSLLFAITFGLCFFFTSAELQRFEHPTKIDGSLSFLVLGDWGRRGAFNQSEVAHQVLNLVFFFFFLNGFW